MGINQANSRANPEAVKGKHPEPKVREKKARGKRVKDRAKDKQKVKEMGKQKVKEKGKEKVKEKVKEKGKEKVRLANPINLASRLNHRAKAKVKSQGMVQAKEPAVKEVLANHLLTPVREQRQNPKAMNAHRRVKAPPVCGVEWVEVVHDPVVQVAKNHSPAKRIPKTAAAVVMAREAVR